jgi:hypothetical protein
MLSVNEQIIALNLQLQDIKSQLGRPPEGPPPRIPKARCTSQTFSVARLVNGIIGPFHDDGQDTKLTAMEACKKMSLRYGAPIKYLSWDTDLATVSGPDAVCLIERLHVTDDEGGNGRRATTKWTFANPAPGWVKFRDTATSEVLA